QIAGDRGDFEGAVAARAVRLRIGVAAPPVVRCGQIAVATELHALALAARADHVAAEAAEADGQRAVALLDRAAARFRVRIERLVVGEVDLADRERAGLRSQEYAAGLVRRRFVVVEEAARHVDR